MFSQIFLNGIYAGTLYGLVAVSFGLIHSTTRIFHIAHAAVFTIAGYLAYTFIVLLKVPPVLGIPAAIVSSAVVGWSIELFVYQPLRWRGSHPNILLLCSLGVFVVLQNIISVLFGDATRRLHDQSSSTVIVLGGGRLTYIQAGEIVISTLVFFGIWIWLKRSQIGREIRAIADDWRLSEIVGSNIRRIFYVIFVLASALAAVGGIMYGLDVDLTPSMGFRILLMSVVAAIVGGISSVPGAFVGGLLIGMLQQASALWLPIHWQDTIVLGILFLFLGIRPQGLCGSVPRQTTT